MYTKVSVREPAEADSMLRDLFQVDDCSVGSALAGKKDIREGIGIVIEGLTRLFPLLCPDVVRQIGSLKDVALEFFVGEEQPSLSAGIGAALQGGDQYGNVQFFLQ